MSRHERRAMIDRGHHELSVVRQCELLDISRSSAYYSPVQADEYELELMGVVDKQYLLTPFYGSRKMAVWLRGQGHQVNRKRVQRLMRRMGIEAIYRRPRTTMPDSGHKVYPYLLRGLEIDRVNQVWAVDITYIPMVYGFMYLVCVMDWHSRYVLSWRLSNTLEADSCVDALEEALSRDLPGVFNTDQGSQFTSEAFTSVLVAHGVRISMDSVGSYMDNVFVERLWRSVKYEEVYLKAYEGSVCFGGMPIFMGIKSQITLAVDQRKTVLIGKLLEWSECHADGELTPPPPEISGYSEKEVHYHIGLCDEAGLLYVQKRTMAGQEGERYQILNLTWSGHNELDRRRSSTS